MRIIHSLPVFLIAAAAACANGPAEVEITAEPIAREAVRSGSMATVRSGHHAIRVRHTIRVPDACHELQGDLLHTGGELTLRLHPEPNGRECAPEETYLAYEAHIRELNPGRYSLRVVHAPSDRRNGSEVVLDHPVAVIERAVNVP